MSLALAAIVGILYTIAVYLLLRRSVVKHIFGLIVLANAANLLIFMGPGLTRAAPPLIGTGTPNANVMMLADPVPQALVLTAIVISFALLAFAAVLVKKAYNLVGTDDVDEMRTSDL